MTSRFALRVAALGVVAVAGRAAAAGPATTRAATDLSTTVDELADPSADVRERADFELQWAAAADLDVAAARPGLSTAVHERLLSLAKAATARERLADRRTAATLAANAAQGAATVAALDARAAENPAWLAVARQATAARHAAAAAPTAAAQRAGRGAADALFDRAVKLGCDDPNVLAEAGLAKGEAGGLPPAALERFVQAKSRFAKHPPQPLWAIVVDGRLVRARTSGLWGGAVTPDGQAGADHDLQEMVKWFAKLAAAPGTPPAAVLAAYDNVARTAAGLPTAIRAYAAADAAVAKALPDDAGALRRRGQVLCQYAWEVRGAGYGRDLADEQVAAFAHYLGLAEAALTRSYELDPDDPETASTMIQVENGQGKGRAVMERWFARAMAADPDDAQACRQKLNYLEPKWHGTPGDLVAFGRECAATRNWRGNLPLVLVDAYRLAAAYEDDPRGYLSGFAVWRDVSAVYGAQLRLRPADAVTRSNLAYFACLGGRWTEAQRQFMAAGDDLDVSVFDSAEQLAGFKKQAAKHAAVP